MDKNFFNGLDKFGYKTALSALGIDKNKRLIAVVAAYNPLSVSTAFAPKLANWVADGLKNNEYDAKVFYLPDFCVVSEGAARHNLQMREYADFFVRSLGESLLFDGFVFVASDVYVVSGMLNGAISCNLPCLFLGNGKMYPCEIEGEKHGLTGLFSIGAKINQGKLSPVVKERAETLIKNNLGNDPFCYHFNSGVYLTQSLGLQLPNAASVLQGSIEQKHLAETTADTICELIRLQCTPQKMLNTDSYRTALAVDLAMGGDCNVLTNLIWLSSASKESVSYKMLQKTCAVVPVLIDAKQGFDVQKFDNDGGIFGIINQLSSASLAFGDYLCFANKPMIDFCRDFSSTNYIKSFSEAKVLPSAFVLNGNLADSAIAYPSTKSAFTGNAKVFDNEDTLVDAVYSKQIKHGDCVILTYCGAKSGLVCPVKAAAALNGAGLSSSIAFVTDGVVPDFFGGIAVSLVYPDAYEDGAIAYAKDGDRIEINLVKGKLNIDLKTKDLSIRRKQTEIKQIVATDKNYLFSKIVSPASEGCQLRFPNKER